MNRILLLIMITMLTACTTTGTNHRGVSSQPMNMAPMLDFVNNNSSVPANNYQPRRQTNCFTHKVDYGNGQYAYKTRCN